MMWGTSKPDGQPRHCLDMNKAEWLLGFKAKISFEEVLRQSIKWYEQARAGAGVTYKL